jgi:hypothetical protein
VDLRGRDVVNALFARDIGCRVRRSANLSIPNLAETSVDFDLEIKDTDNMFDLLQPTRITFNKAGAYAVGGCGNLNANAVGGRFGAIRRNGGSHIVLDSKQAVSTAFVGTVVNPGTIFDMAAADYIEFRVFQGSGAALDLLSVADNSPTMWAQKIDRGG